MSRTGILILLGVLIILVPFSGLPIALRSLLLVACGISVLVIGLSLRVREAQSEVVPEVKLEMG
jgi:VIT1/CCC1 family predicted Fe2+/Mn2+ transporter